MPYRISSSVAWQDVCNETVLVDLATCRVIGLNPAGALIWSLLEHADLETIAEQLTERFEIDPETARADLDSFLNQLCEREYIVPQ